MSLSREEFEKLTLLARLELTEDEKKILFPQVDAIISYVSKLSELNLKDVEPYSYAASSSLNPGDDKPSPSLSIDDVMRNAPERKDAFFKCPRVIKDTSS